ncbi:MAG TPA: hypothetical protein VGI03_02555 [Verrucomicrobiae bacterium]
MDDRLKMSGGRTNRSWVDVAVFESASEGKTLEAFLKDKKFEARTYDDKLLRYFLFLRPPRVTYRVQIRESEFKIVATILEKESPPVLNQAFHCPSCGSLRINYPQMTRKFLMPTILLHLGIIFRVIDHGAYCEHCHHVWNLPKDGMAVTPKERPAKPFFPF